MIHACAIMKQYSKLITVHVEAKKNGNLKKKLFRKYFLRINNKSLIYKLMYRYLIVWISTSGEI